MSTFIERLHRDCRGVVASAELIMALPVFLLFWVLLWEFGVAASTKVTLAAETRTASFLDAYAGACWARGNHQEAMIRRANFHVPTCSRRAWPDADRFWREMDGKGGQGLTGDVSKAKPPRLVEARLQADFTFHSALRWPVQNMVNRVVVMEPVRYINDDPNLTYGYDRVLKRRLSSGHGALITLFPNVFRGAR